MSSLVAPLNPTGLHADAQKTLNDRLVLEAIDGSAAGVLDCLQKGADPNHRLRRGRDALMNAAMRGHASCVQVLLEWSPTLAMAQDFKQHTALMMATWEGHAPCVRLLLPLSNAQAVDQDGVSALMMSCLCKSQEVFSLLLPVSDVRQKNQQGSTALMLSARSGREEFVVALATNNDWEATDGQGRTVVDNLFDMAMDSDLVSPFEKDSWVSPWERLAWVAPWMTEAQRVAIAEELTNEPKHEAPRLRSICERWKIEQSLHSNASSSSQEKNEQTLVSTRFGRKRL